MNYDATNIISWDSVLRPSSFPLFSPNLAVVIMTTHFKKCWIKGFLKKIWNSNIIRLDLFIASRYVFLAFICYIKKVHKVDVVG